MHPSVLEDLYDATRNGWIVPWAILPEIDYLVATHLGTKAQEASSRISPTGLFG